MSNNKKYSQKTIDDALALTKKYKKNGQTKEQSKLIEQGIRKGIEEYKKREKEKIRERDKLHKKQQSKRAELTINQGTSDDNINFFHRHLALPWILLIVSWLGFALFTFLDT